jgi:hypothetical protein
LQHATLGLLEKLGRAFTAVCDGELDGLMARVAHTLCQGGSGFGRMKGAFKVVGGAEHSHGSQSVRRATWIRTL